MAQTPLELTRTAADFLEERGVEDARLEAELLLAGVLDLRRLDLYLQFDRPLTEEELERFRGFVRRRMRDEPIQYILGEAHFRELVLAVDPRALIPRPETEQLVGHVLEWADAVATQRAASLRALDVGTGSGAIALSLAAEGPFGRVVATDTSAEALELAAENARRSGLEERVEFRRGPIFEPLAGGERFDVVVSNPPYVAERDRAGLDAEVREWEPDEALFARRGGLDMLEALVNGAPDRLGPDGLLALEVGLGQAERVAGRIEESGAYSAPRIVCDLAERERFVLASRAPADHCEQGGADA